MFNIEKAHMILDEVVANGEIVETNRIRILAPVSPKLSLFPPFLYATGMWTARYEMPHALNVKKLLSI